MGQDQPGPWKSLSISWWDSVDWDGSLEVVGYTTVPTPTPTPIRQAQPPPYVFVVRPLPYAAR